MENDTTVIDAVLEIYFKLLDFVCTIFKMSGTPGQVAIITITIVLAILTAGIVYWLIKNNWNIRGDK